MAESAAFKQSKTSFSMKNRPGEIMGDVQRSLRITRQLLAGQMPRPPVERIEREVSCSSFFASASRCSLAENNDFEISRAEIVGVETQANGSNVPVPSSNFCGSNQSPPAHDSPPPSTPGSSTPCKMRRMPRRRDQDNAGKGRGCNMASPSAGLALRRVSRSMALRKCFSASANSPRRRCHKPMALLQRESSGSRRNASRQ